MFESSWPYLPTLLRLVLALALGLFVGLERERRGKEAGVRTFAFAALLGCLGGLLGDAFALLSIAVLALLTVMLNWQSMRSNHGTELTTSAALLVTGFVGVLCGKGHSFTPVAVGIATAALLAWKQPLAGFSIGLTETELRAAILLGILSFVVYPVLPPYPLDPWGLIEPRAAWLTVILIAAIGFGNYILMKLYGRRGVEAAGFLAGLVNSTVAVTELSARARDVGASLADGAYRGILLSDAAMALRNAVLLAILSRAALLVAALPLLVIFISSIVLAWLPRPTQRPSPSDVASVRIESPFSLRAALKFGLAFLALSIAGGLAQRFLGAGGFYAVSLGAGSCRAPLPWRRPAPSPPTAI